MGTILPFRVTTEDRCDRCVAAGQLKVRLEGGSDLVFCGHHANKFAERLAKVTAVFAENSELGFEWKGRDFLPAAA